MNLAFDTTISLTTIISLALSAGTAVFAWYRTRSKELENRLRDGQQRMDRHDARLARLEQTVQGLPATADMFQLQLSLSEMAGDMKAMAEAMKGHTKVVSRLEAIVARHEDHLLDGAKR